MVRHALLILVLSSVVLAAPKAGQKKAAAPPPPPPPAPVQPMPKVVENVTDKVMQTFQSATKVQVWRVGTSGGLRPEASRAIGSDFQREVAGKELGAADLKTLRGIFYDEKSYKWDTDVSQCNFVPNASFQILSGLDTLEALVSFKCNQVFFFAGKPGGRWLPGGAFDMKPARKALLELVKAALHDDPTTQALK